MSLTIHTSLGDIKVRLHWKQVPRICENFLALCASNVYDGTIVVRNIADFIVQMGDPTNTGEGGTCTSETGYIDDMFHSDLKHHQRGVISMANEGTPNTIRSQFFITYDAQPTLDGQFSVFGRVVDGWSVLDAMERVSVNEETYLPRTPILLHSVTIHANPLA